MKRATGMDVMFLCGETPSWHMHVCGALVLDPSTVSLATHIDDPVERLLAIHRSTEEAKELRLRLPTSDLSMGGARVLAAYPLGPLIYGSGLNATVCSLGSNIHFGFLACAEHVPDPWSIADGVAPALDELTLAARGQRDGRASTRDHPQGGR